MSLLPRVALLLSCGLLTLGGCSGPGAAAIGTTSAVVVGGALSPLNKAYDVATNKRERTHARFVALYARLDPIAEQKIAAILARDPVADARMLHAAGVVALLPAVPGHANYPGLEGSSYDVSRVAHDPAAANASALYSELNALMDPYAKDLTPAPGEPNYHNETFRRFLAAEAGYKMAFNREIYRLETGETPRIPVRRRYKSG